MPLRIGLKIGGGVYGVNVRSGLNEVLRFFDTKFFLNNII